MLGKGGRAAPCIFADPVRNARVSLENLLDTLNVQGPKPVALLNAVVVAARAEAQPYKADAADRLAAAASRELAEDLGKMGAAERAAQTEMIKRHMASALDGLSQPLLQKLTRFIQLFPSWKPDSKGRVDNAPRLRSEDAECSFSQDELHCVRHLIYCFLPAWTTIDQVISTRRELFKSKATPASSAPCALITVGPVGSGKSWVLNGGDGKTDEIIGRSFGRRFPAPPLSDFCTLDPDSVLHGLCAGMKIPFDPTLRAYGNFINHENFCCAVSLRKHIIFDGSGRDPTNICGRVISRLRAAGYRVVFLVVLTSFETARRRAIERARRTGRETSESFTRFVYRSLQTSLPIYLNGCGDQASAADGVLLFTNDTDGGRPTLEHTLVGEHKSGVHAHEHAATLSAALALTGELLKLPPEPPTPRGAPPPPMIKHDDDDSSLSMGELMAAAGVLYSRLKSK